MKRFAVVPLLLSFCFGVHVVHALADAGVPADLMNRANAIKNERSRVKRLELFQSLTAEIKKKVDALSDNIPESEIPRVQTLYELHLLLGNVKTESLNPASCGEAQKVIWNWSNPTGAPDAELSASCRYVLEVVRSACAP